MENHYHVEIFIKQNFPIRDLWLKTVSALKLLKYLCVYAYFAYIL